MATTPLLKVRAVPPQTLSSRAPLPLRPAVWCVWQWQLLSKEGTSLSPRDERHLVFNATLSLHPSFSQRTAPCPQKVPLDTRNPPRLPSRSFGTNFPPDLSSQSISAFTSNSWSHQKSHSQVQCLNWGNSPEKSRVSFSHLCSWSCSPSHFSPQTP